MAIQAEINDTEYNEAYLKISKYTGRKSDAGYTVEVYENQTARDDNETPIELWNFAFDYDTDSADGILQQAYTDLTNYDGITNPTNV